MITQEETVIPTPRELLKEKANLLGIEYRSNISDEKLQQLIDEKMNPNIKEDTKDKTENEIVSEAITNMREVMTKLKRCVITCMDPAMKEWDTTPYLSISNSILTLPKIVIPFGVEWHVPQAYYDMIKTQKCFMSVKGKDIKGRAITVRKEINKYAIQDLPDLNEKELAELKQAQIMRDGILA